MKALNKIFLIQEYDSEEYPASVARAMYDKDLLNLFVTTYGTKENIKVYIRWIRKIRKLIFPNSKIKSKDNKFVSIFGINRKMTVGDFIIKEEKYLRK